MIYSTNYYYFKSAISKENCDKIKELGNSKLFENAVTRGEKQKTENNKMPIDTKTFQKIKREGGNIDNYYIRDSKVSWLNDQWIYNLIHPFVHEANKKAGWNVDWDWSESCQFTKYEPGGFYAWHQDASADNTQMYKRYIHGLTEESLNTKKIPKTYLRNNMMIGKTRKLSVTVNLTDPSEYEGGNLMFDFGEHSENNRFHLCKEAREQGSIIVFPSSVYHMVQPIEKGTRYSLVMWNLGRPLR